jgi:hypothetical protein
MLENTEGAIKKRQSKETGNIGCLVYPMLPVSLDCPFLLHLRYSLTFICPVSCVSYVASSLECPFSLPLWYSQNTEGAIKKRQSKETGNIG